MDRPPSGDRLRRLEGLGGLAKLDFGADGTPLQVKPALGAALGLRGALHVKRDDRAGPGMGGNKTRKLQYVVADALARGADCLITSGAVQSNHAALTAVCGGMAGLEVHLVLGGDPEEMRGGNLVDRPPGRRHIRTSSPPTTGSCSSPSPSGSPRSCAARVGART